MYIFVWDVQYFQDSQCSGNKPLVIRPDCSHQQKIWASSVKHKFGEWV